jgi:hypothetical protein
MRLLKSRVKSNSPFKRGRYIDRYRNTHVLGLYVYGAPAMRVRAATAACEARISTTAGRARRFVPERVFDVSSWGTHQEAPRMDGSSIGTTPPWDQAICFLKRCFANEDARPRAPAAPYTRRSRRDLIGSRAK